MRPKVIAITGGSRGIGAEMVRTFTKNGWQCAFCYEKSTEKALELSHETGAMAVQCDVSDEASVKHFIAQVKKAYRHLDALICCAGISVSGLYTDLSLDEWNHLFSVNVTGAFLASKEVLPDMISAQCGSILFISSMWGQVGASCEVAYSASKAALIGLTKALAKEVGPSYIRVNCLAPGVIDTDMMRAYSDKEKAELSEDTPLMRLGTPKDIASAALFLSSDAASFITGQVLGVNGGFVI